MALHLGLQDFFAGGGAGQGNPAEHVPLEVQALLQARAQEQAAPTPTGLLQMLPPQRNISLENKDQVRQHITDKGVDNARMKGIMANIDVETGGTFDFTTKQKGDRNDPAEGLFQFDPRGKGLLKPYLQYLEDVGIEDSSEAQIDFMVDSLEGDYKPGEKWIGLGKAKKWRAITDPEEATRFFSSEILNPGTPHLDRRLKSLKDQRF